MRQTYEHNNSERHIKCSRSGANVQITIRFHELGTTESKTFVFENAQTAILFLESLKNHDSDIRH